MWIVAEYEATALFSLKPATATSSGGKTLLVPTPYAVKMALLDAACRLDGQRAAEIAWDGWLRGLTVAIRPAARIVVNNLFTKVLRQRRSPAEPGSRHAGFFQQTIAYREYAHLGGTFGLALEPAAKADVGKLKRWLLAINYLGKRGSFIQIVHPPREEADLPQGFIRVDGVLPEQFAVAAVMTQLDDAGDRLTFSKASIYSGERITLGKERVLRHVILPYKLVASSRGYSHYELSGEGEP